MPVVTIAAPVAGDASALVHAVAGRMAEALGLPPSGVIAVHSPTGASSGGTWIVVTAHGGDRGDLAAAALDAAAAEVRSWADAAGVPVAGVWTEWVLPRAGA